MSMFRFFTMCISALRSRLGFALQIGLLLPLQLAAAEGYQPVLQTAEFHFPDGGSSSFFSLQKPPGLAVLGGVENWIFVVGGSGCRSMKRFLPQYFTGLEGESGRSRIWILQKRFVSQTEQNPACSEDFIRHDHFSQWLADQQRFIRTILSEPRSAAGAATQSKRRVIIMGISEGAEVAPVLALSIKETSHLVLLAHSGASAMETYRLLAERYPHMRDGWHRLTEGLQIRPADPDRSILLEHSWRYWNEISAVDHAGNLNALKLPVLWAYGQADPLIAGDAQARLSLSLQPGLRRNWRVCAFPEADHGLMTANTNRMPDFMWQLDRWLLDGSDGNVCSALPEVANEGAGGIAKEESGN